MRLQLLSIAAIIATIFVYTNSAHALGWEELDRILIEGIKDHTTPGIQVVVGTSERIYYHKTFGNFTYGIPPPHNGFENPPVKFNSIFDMASLTKVLMTTTTAMILYDRGLLHLDTKLSDASLLGAHFSQNGKEAITVKNLLLHNSGFPPDPIPGYGAKSFGCPESQKLHPQLAFTCVDKIFENMLSQKLQNPIGAKYVYSDLSMITLAFAFGKLIQQHGLVQPSQLSRTCIDATKGGGQWHCYFHTFITHHIVQPLRMHYSGFNPPISQYSNALPAWNDTVSRHRVIQGEVSDENAFALGGFAGHAGFWSTASDTFHLTSSLLANQGHFIAKGTVELFTKVYNDSFSSRALGWDTNANINTYKGCASLSTATFEHTGYTGTQTCNDPERKVTTVLLTNRVYPGKVDTAEKIKFLRQKFNTVVQQIFDSNNKSFPPPVVQEMAYLIPKTSH